MTKKLNTTSLLPFQIGRELEKFPYRITLNLFDKLYPDNIFISGHEIQEFEFKISKWLDDNTKCYYFKNDTFTDYIFYFKDKDDAMKFKLVWS